MRVPLRQTDRKFLVPRPTASYRRRAWLDFQLALDPLAQPTQVRPARA